MGSWIPDVKPSNLSRHRRRKVDSHRMSQYISYLRVRWIDAPVLAPTFSSWQGMSYLPLPFPHPNLYPLMISEPFRQLFRVWREFLHFVFVMNYQVYPCQNANCHKRHRAIPLSTAAFLHDSVPHPSCLLWVKYNVSCMLLDCPAAWWLYRSCHRCLYIRSPSNMPSASYTRLRVANYECIPPHLHRPSRLFLSWHYVFLVLCGCWVFFCFYT